MLRSIATLFSAAALLAAAPTTFAQQVTVPPLVRLVLPFAPGAATDVIARAVAQQLGTRFGTNVIVENRVGGTGIVAATAVIKGPKDGSMLLFTSSSAVTTAATMKVVPFDITTDLVPVAIVADGPMLVGVSATAGVKTPAELVAYARNKQGGLTAGSGGVGSVGHLSAELLADAGKFPLLHIPYKGAALALVDVASGLTDVLVASNSSMVSQIKSGRVIPVAITSTEQNPHFPGIPTMDTAAPGYRASIWYGVMAPTGLPPALVQRLNKEIVEVSKTAEVRELLKMDGATPVTATPEELTRRIREEYATWKRLASSKNIVVE